MWYKYLNRATDDLRLFRRANIKFNQDDFGMLKFKFVSKSNDYLFRLLRTEGTLRGAGSFALAAAFSILFYLKSHYYDPVYTAPKLIEQKRKDEEMDRKARETLFHNNLGVPTRPTRKIEDFMTFITSSEALNKNFEYMMFGLDLNSDQMAGLDSYSTENDERMLEMLAESKRRQGGH